MLKQSVCTALLDHRIDDVQVDYSIIIQASYIPATECIRHGQMCVEYQSLKMIPFQPALVLGVGR